MIRLTIMIVIISVLTSAAQIDSSAAASSVPSDTFSQTSSVNDIDIVKSILTAAGIKDRTAEEAAVFENGRAVSLDLSNKDVASDGISVLPADIGKLTALKTLLCKNNIISVIPPELMKCSQLTKIDFNSNRINEIPLEFGQLDNLIDIDFRYNRLEALPYTIGNLKALETLRLWGNRLVTLPSQITLLPSLKELYIKDNRISYLPIEITQMKSLVYVDLTGNKLCDVSKELESWLILKDKSYKMGQKCW